MDVLVTNKLMYRFLHSVFLGCSEGAVQLAVLSGDITDKL